LLESYGWSPELQRQFEPHAAEGLAPGRVTVQQRGQYTVVTEDGELAAEISGRFAHEAAPGEFPVVGDWVGAAVRPLEGTATIQAVLPRTTAFRRKAAGEGFEEQVIAANVDTAFLVAALTRDLNVRRLERYLTMTWESGAKPVIVLTKSDIAEDLAGALLEVESVAYGVPVHPISAIEGEGLDELRRYLGPGETVVLLGSSGAGKSTLVNVLAGDQLFVTKETRDDDRGRHTTSHRELVLLPGGGMILDTPGMRELGLWDAATSLAGTFEDVEALVLTCRFADCAHDTEPDCAVRAALADGSLDAARWDSFVRLERELEFLERKGDPGARAAARKAWAARSKAMRTSSW
jgi:ribosome biogenesis GTPase / thiamine phosphate phosphatase